MRFLVKLIAVAVIALVSYQVYERPEIQELFKESRTNGDPLAFLEDLPEVKPKVRPEKSPRTRKPSVLESEVVTDADTEPALEEETETLPEYQNQVPNDELRKVLMQILAAKKLAGGISLAVTDQEITLAGDVASAEDRKEILDIVDRGRETRRINGRDLKVRN